MPLLRERQTVHYRAERDTNRNVAEAGHDGGRRLLRRDNAASAVLSATRKLNKERVRLRGVIGQ